MNKEIMVQAHKLTRELKQEFKNIDYKFQLGISIKFLIASMKKAGKTVEQKRVTLKSTGLRINGASGLWYTIALFLLESEKWGEEIAGIVVLESGRLVLSSGYNGFNDIEQSHLYNIQELNNMRPQDRKANLKTIRADKFENIYVASGNGLEYEIRGNKFYHWANDVDTIVKPLNQQEKRAVEQFKKINKIA